MSYFQRATRNFNRIDLQRRVQQVAARERTRKKRRRIERFCNTHQIEPNQDHKQPSPSFLRTNKAHWCWGVLLCARRVWLFEQLDSQSKIKIRTASSSTNNDPFVVMVFRCSSCVGRSFCDAHLHRHEVWFVRVDCVANRRQFKSRIPEWKSH